MCFNIYFLKSNYFPCIFIFPLYFFLHIFFSISFSNLIFRLQSLYFPLTLFREHISSAWLNLFFHHILSTFSLFSVYIFAYPLCLLIIFSLHFIFLNDFSFYLLLILIVFFVLSPFIQFPVNIHSFPLRLLGYISCLSACHHHQL